MFGKYLGKEGSPQEETLGKPWQHHEQTRNSGSFSLVNDVNADKRLKLLKTMKLHLDLSCWVEHVPVVNDGGMR